MYWNVSIHRIKAKLRMFREEPFFMSSCCSGSDFSRTYGDDQNRTPDCEFRAASPLLSQMSFSEPLDSILQLGDLEIPSTISWSNLLNVCDTQTRGIRNLCPMLLASLIWVVMATHSLGQIKEMVYRSMKEKRK